MKYLKSFEQWCLEEEAHNLLNYYNLGNNPLPANQIGRSANKLVNFHCDVCNLEWKRVLNKIRELKITNCPYCNHRKPSPFYSLQTQYPMITKQWDYEKNKKLPSQYLPRSDEIVFWKCKTCGNKWDGKITDRVQSYIRSKKERKNTCPYCNHERVWSGYNLLTEHPEIARQWDYEKNGNINPMDIFPKSNLFFYWKCDFNPNHVWKERVSNRTVLHRTCPKCAREFKMSYPAKAIYYYLRNVFPDCICEVKIKSFTVDILIPSYKIAIEHDGEYSHRGKEAQERDKRKDETLKEEGYHVIRLKESRKQDKKISKIGYIIYYLTTYQYNYLDLLIKELFSYLSNITNQKYKVNPNHELDNYKIEQLYFHEKKGRTLAVKNPDLAKEWSPNNKEKPDMISYRNSKEVLWICNKCVEEYPATVANRTAHNSGCPHCCNRKANYKNCLETKYPALAKEWDYEKNGNLTPKDVTPGTEKEVYWKCEKGHSFKNWIYLRTMQKDPTCPQCKLDRESLQTKNPELSLWWDYENNSPLTPDQITFASNLVVGWKCKKEHKFPYQINKIRTKNKENWCPVCKKEQVNQIRKRKKEEARPKNKLATGFPEILQIWDYKKIKLQ